ncbi:MAG: DUF4258 domain-containing protein [Pseudolabrys sp.]
MSLPDIVLTRHAETALFERALDRRLVEQTLREPDFVEPDEQRGTINAFRAIPEHGGRIPRVTYVSDGSRMKVITAFFDRRRRR